MVESTSLLKMRSLNSYRGFESLPHRQFFLHRSELTFSDRLCYVWLSLFSPSIGRNRKIILPFQLLGVHHALKASTSVEPKDFNLTAPGVAADVNATIRVDMRARLPAGIEQPGDMIGPYKLIELLGEGGFGAVWRAQQNVPIRREVALKLIKPGMDSREIITRFETEKQTLALMDHPNIAGVLDAGTTDLGRPYFVMELVRGVPITEYCDAKKLTIRQRLELFIPVCQAVQHAHQKSILHRDLKPSNILVEEVDGRAVPKVIDFGIAKALGGMPEAVLQNSLARTLEGTVIGTPQYMSPEQAGAKTDIDTRSDIYTLGVILFELLTGTTPLTREQLKQSAFDQMLKLIRESESARPSSRVMPVSRVLSAEVTQTCTARGTEPTRLNRMLRGDLDWITLKALEKERERRYETANALAAMPLSNVDDFVNSR